MKTRTGSHSSQIFAVLGLLICFAGRGTADPQETSEILVRRTAGTNSSEGAAPKILRVSQGEVVRLPEEPSFTMKSDPVRVQSDFRTTDISVINRQRDKENAKKVAIVQEDLQSRIKIKEQEPEPETQGQIQVETPEDPEEVLRKQARVKEDIESRLLTDDGFPGYGEREETYHYPVKRSDDDYYEEPEPLQQRTTTESAKEEDSFFSIFESLFGSSDDESQTKKKSKPEDDPAFKDSGDAVINENIKTVGDILKPLRPINEPESKPQNLPPGYQSDAPEYRIVNNFHGSQSYNPGFKPPAPKPSYHNFYRPTEKPFRPYKPHSTNGYEDYDLEEFMDKGEATTRVKYVSPIITTTTPVRTYPTSSTTTTTTTTKTTTATSSSTAATTTTTTTAAKTTPKIVHDNKLKFPSVQKKNDYINRNRYQETTERTTERKPETKTTTEVHYYSKPNHENKANEIKTQKIQESANFYNLINLPVRYSTKDTAIPLISTSYANTKIQGMGAHKYEKGANGKYPNHKYDQVSTTTTKRPNYWATKRTSTERTTTSFRPSQLISKTTIKYVPGSDLDKVEYDDMPIGLGPAFGGYGSKTNAGQKETTTKRNDDFNAGRPPATEVNRGQETEKTSGKPAKEVYEEYEYDGDSGQESRPVGTNANYPPQVNYASKEQFTNEVGYKNGYNTARPATVTPATEAAKPQEVIEYEYYDYDVDPTTTTTSTTTTTTTTTTPRYKLKYPGLSKDKIKTSGSEKVAVVVPSKDHDFYNENYETTRASSPTTTTTTTTTSTPAPKTSSTAADTTPEFKMTTPEQYKPNQGYKEPAPVFEDVKEDEYTTKQFTTSTAKKVATEKPTTEAATKPVTVPSPNKDPEGNSNVVLVPAKETVKNADTTEKKHSQPDPGLKTHQRPGAYDYTTEFTVGVVHGGPKKPPQGHFVASSIATNPYGDNEPFRPIAKPPGLSASFQVVREESQRHPPKNPLTFHKRPFPTPPPLQETEPIHEPHEFIPSPQFHRPGEPKPSIPIRPGHDVDYDFEGIQTEPKPGQYVIFSKPQLNPEMNENQLKKKPEINAPSKVITNAPHYQNQFVHEGQKHVVFNPKDGQIYQTLPEPRPSEKVESGRPVYETQDGRLPLDLVPPRGTQTEKPFEGNFVIPEGEKQESTVSYPRPHWEKNGKPSFLMNKNDMIDGHHPPLPPQMAPTLIPPSSIPPQRFRRPIQPHMPPMRKNFNEAGTNVKPKPNLPNILPQFRPNTKVGAGPYHRPPGHVASNRRNGVNRYHDKEHGNFPYHIQHPDKEGLMHRDYEMGPEIIPKFITNRGKLPSEAWASQGMLKRYGQGPININSRSEHGNPPNQRVLRRHQRTPVTTLQMLKQMPGVKTQKTQISREDSGDPPALLVPPIYRTYADEPKTEENLYIVYPAKAPQKLHPDNGKVFIVSDTKSHRNFYNFTKSEEQHPLLNPTKRGNDKPKNNFPYGFVRPDERPKLNRKQQQDGEEDARKGEQQDPKAGPPQKDEKIDMVLHMQSNNQWNEVKTAPEVIVSGENLRGDRYRFSEASQKNVQQQDPPSEYHTSIKDDSAFTLGAVMHAVSEGNRKGQVASVSLLDDQKEVDLPKLNVNERISNGKIVTVSMPLDVKREDKEDPAKYNFQPPFQASSSLTSNESQTGSQGWSIVKNPEDKTDGESGNPSTETSTNSQFNFENFKPELIGGFKPIYELPEEPEESKKPETEKETETEREERKLDSR